MKLTDKINFRQPKYMLPLIVYLPVIGTAYFVFDMFDTKIEDKPAANLQTTEYLNSDLPEAQIKGGDGIGGRYESMVKSYGKIEDHSAISNIDRNNQDEKEEYESKYSDAELELLDKEAAQSASMQDKELQEANARERDREAIAELQKALAEARLNGQKGLEPDSDKSDGSPESDGKVEMKGKIEINDKAVKGLSDAEKPNEVVKKVKTSSDYFNTLTENEKEPNLIKAIIDENRLPKIMMPACWYYDRRRAGFLRNEDMLAIADALVAFWDGESHGTKHMIEISQEKGIPVWVFNYKNNKSEQK